jgi:hypothetical protein
MYRNTEKQYRQKQGERQILLPRRFALALPTIMILMGWAKQKQLSENTLSLRLKSQCSNEDQQSFPKRIQNI